VQVGGTRTFNSGALYTYSGTSAQVTGTGLPTNVDTLIINNANGVILSQPTTVNNRLTLGNGNIILGNNNLTVNITCNPLIESTVDYSLLPSISVQRTNPYFNFNDMYFSGYTSFVSDSQLCQLNNALFSLIIIIGNDTYTFPMYYSTSLTDYPSLEFYGPFLEESFLSIPYISNCVVDLTNNTIVVQSEIINGVEYYADDIIQVAINISYNISCVSVSGIPC
jgi:hypothetical protein